MSDRLLLRRMVQQQQPQRLLRPSPHALLPGVWLHLLPLKPPPPLSSPSCHQAPSCCSCAQIE